MWRAAQASRLCRQAQVRRAEESMDSTDYLESRLRGRLVKEAKPSGEDNLGHERICSIDQLTDSVLLLKWILPHPSQTHSI